MMANTTSKQTSGPTGGIQGWSQGTMFGYNYSSTGLINSIVEVFGGPHDFIGGQVTGFYDAQGNIRRGMSDAEKTTFNIWAAVAIPIATPFAASTTIPAPIWNAISNLAK